MSGFCVILLGDSLKLPAHQSLLLFGLSPTIAHLCNAGAQLRGRTLLISKLATFTLRT